MIWGLLKRILFEFLFDIFEANDERLHRFMTINLDCLLVNHKCLEFNATQKSVKNFVRET